MATANRRPNGKPRKGSMKHRTSTRRSKTNAMKIPLPRSRMDRPVLASGKTGYVKSLADGKLYPVADNRRREKVVVLTPRGKKRMLNRAKVVDVPKPKNQENSTMATKNSKSKSKRTPKNTKKVTAKGSAARTRGKKQRGDDDEIEMEDDDEEVTSTKRRGKSKTDEDEDDVVDSDEDDSDDDSDEDDDSDSDDDSDEDDADSDEDDDDGSSDEDDDDDDDDDDDEVESKKGKGKAKAGKGKTKPAADEEELPDDDTALLKMIVGLMKENNGLFANIGAAIMNASKVVPAGATVATDAPTGKKGKGKAADEESDEAETPKGKKGGKEKWVDVKEAKELKKGDEIRAEIDDEWFPAKVTKVGRKNVAYTFYYEDGEKDKGVSVIGEERVQRKA